MVSTSQYSVPAKYAPPVVRPRKKAWGQREVRDERTSATTSGVSATQANAGWPNFGKLSARSAPEARASAKSRA